ncbi:hypothetical protein M231_08068 [Tremella mesenterica]|uniref:Uncharacterized protein n=1 Tax=Tremella mesenterica TaxID=5217 RepID=A0A4Q1BAJ4_TREME|nr:hypothetical protein M231_08068 [Tremella mesenterica]
MGTEEDMDSDDSSLSTLTPSNSEDSQDGDLDSQAGAFPEVPVPISLSAPEHTNTSRINARESTGFQEGTKEEYPGEGITDPSLIMGVLGPLSHDQSQVQESHSLVQGRALFSPVETMGQSSNQAELDAFLDYTATPQFDEDMRALSAALLSQTYPGCKDQTWGVTG